MERPLKNTPYENSKLAKYLDRRILELAGKKSQREIALQAGFPNPNYVSMLKAGSSKLPLDRVPTMAKALEVDPKFLFILALEQAGFETTQAAVDDIFKTIVTDNEVDWLNEIRDASCHSDPRLTNRLRTSLRAIFGA